MWYLKNPRTTWQSSILPFLAFLNAQATESSILQVDLPLAVPSSTMLMHGLVFTPALLGSSPTITSDASKNHWKRGLMLHKVWRTTPMPSAPLRKQLKHCAFIPHIVFLLLIQIIDKQHNYINDFLVYWHLFTLQHYLGFSLVISNSFQCWWFNYLSW